MAKPLLTSHMRGWKPWTAAQSAAVKELAAKKLQAQHRKEEARVVAILKTYDTEAAHKAEVARCTALFPSIRAEVCRYIGVDESLFSTTSRLPKIVSARMVVVYLMRKNTPLSFPQLQILMTPHTGAHSTGITQMQRLRAKWDDGIGGGDPRTFREIIEAFDSATLKFREVGNGNRPDHP